MRACALPPSHPPPREVRPYRYLTMGRCQHGSTEETPVPGPQIPRALAPDQAQAAFGGAPMRRIMLRSTLVATVAAMLVSATVLAGPPGTNSAASEAAACAALYSVPANVGPEPRSACQ